MNELLLKEVTLYSIPQPGFEPVPPVHESGCFTTRPTSLMSHGKPSAVGSLLLV